jgi:hypothetical protein
MAAFPAKHEYLVIPAVDPVASETFPWTDQAFLGEFILLPSQRHNAPAVLTPQYQRRASAKSGLVQGCLKGRLELLLFDLRIDALDVFDRGEIVATLAILSRFERFNEDRFQRGNELRRFVVLRQRLQLAFLGHWKESEPRKPIPSRCQPIDRMFEEPTAQRTVG